MRWNWIARTVAFAAAVWIGGGISGAVVQDEFDCERLGTLWEDATKEELRDPPLHMRSQKLYFNQAGQADGEERLNLLIKAARAGELAIHLDDTDPEYFMRTGMTYGELGCWALAGEMFQRAADLARDDEKKEELYADIENNQKYYWTGRFQAAMERMNEGELEGAAEEFRNAIALDAGDYRAWMNLGIVFAQMEKAEEALEPLRQAQQLDPENEQVMEILRQVLAMVAAGKYNEAQTTRDDAEREAYWDEALNLFQEAVDLEAAGEELDSYESNIAYIYMAKGQAVPAEDEAAKKEEFEKAIEHFRTACIARNAHREEIGEQVRTLETDEDYITNVLSCLLAVGEYDSTKVYAQQLINLNPRRQEGYRFMGEALRNLGDQETALTYLLVDQNFSRGEPVEDINSHIASLITRYSPSDDIVKRSIINLESPEDILVVLDGDTSYEVWIWWSKGYADSYYNGKFTGQITFNPVDDED